MSETRECAGGRRKPMSEDIDAAAEAEAFGQRKAAAVAKAEAALRAAGERLEKALAVYDVEVAQHEERGDGFFSSSYLVARKQAVLARKSFDARTSALNTARAEAAAAMLPLANGVDR